MEASADSARILVVEDEKIVARDIKNRLRNLGYTVPAIVSSGEEAIQKAEEIRPDLVLMDIVLKGKIDGVKAAKEIYTRFDIPVIYLTAYSDKETLRRVKMTEPFGYIHKPFEIKEMRSSIEIALHKHHVDKKLKEKKKWLALTLKSIGDGVITTDTEGVITFMNPVAESLTAWEKEEALGKNISDVFKIITEETRSPLPNPVKNVLNNSPIRGHQVILISKNGKEVLIEKSAAPIRDDIGNISGVVLAFRKLNGLLETRTKKFQQPEPTEKIKLIIICSTIFREGIRKILEPERDIEIIAEASSDQEIIPSIEQSRPNVLLIDAAICNSDIAELMNSIREKSPETKVLLLLHTIDEDEVIKNISSGVRGCLTDVSNKEHLIQAIRTVSKDSIWMEMSSITNVLTRLIPVRKSKSGLQPKLTRREEEIVNLIVLGYSNKQISNTLFISENTVKTHLANIFSKYGITNRLQLIKHVF
ncbi:MAG TPA: response regulator [Thermodesulfobacteriota bacterium]|nr:response regulator [Thermodesulfobacteriota bacterium]